MQQEAGLGFTSSFAEQNGEIETGHAVVRIAQYGGAQEFLGAIQFAASVGDDRLQHREAVVLREGLAGLAREDAGIVDLTRGQVARDQPECEVLILRLFAASLRQIGQRSSQTFVLDAEPRSIRGQRGEFLRFDAGQDHPRGRGFHHGQAQGGQRRGFACGSLLQRHHQDHGQ